MLLFVLILGTKLSNVAQKAFDWQEKILYNYEMNKINQDNWNHTYYNRGDMRACITIAAEQKEEDIVLEYVLTLLDPTNKEIHQASFLDLAKATKAINDEYAHWEFVDMEKEVNKNTNSSGCSSCQAH